MLPAEARWRVRERVVDVLRDAFARYGYGEIVTPTFEETEVFVRGVGTSTDVVRKEMYTFDDRAGQAPDPVRRGSPCGSGPSCSTACTSSRCR